MHMITFLIFIYWTVAILLFSCWYFTEEKPKITRNTVVKCSLVVAIWPITFGAGILALWCKYKKSGK